MSADHRTTDNCTRVVQLRLFDPVPPEKAGGMAGVPPLERASVVQAVQPPAKARAHAPFALSRSGGTPMPSAKHKAVQSTGRTSDGPACVGCSSYQYKSSYSGICNARQELTVAANDRRACALYVFYARARQP